MVETNNSIETNDDLVRLEDEFPDLAEFFSDWCNGGNNGHKLKITEDDILVTDQFGRQLSTHVRVGQKVGRNDPCPCGSGKKFKKCCG